MLTRSTMPTFHAIAVGKQTGIFQAEWDDVEPLVKGFSGCKHKKFHNLTEAQAWMSRQKVQATTVTAMPMPPMQQQEFTHQQHAHIAHDVVIRPSTLTTGATTGPKRRGSNMMSIIGTSFVIIGLLYMSIMCM